MCGLEEPSASAYELMRGDDKHRETVGFCLVARLCAAEREA